MATNIKKLREEVTKKKLALKEAENKEAQRIGKLALNAGVLDYDITDDQWIELFKDAVIRFSTKED